MDKAVAVQVKNKYKVCACLLFSVLSVLLQRAPENSAATVNRASQPKNKTCTVKLDLYPFSPYVSTLAACARDELLVSVSTTNVSSLFHACDPQRVCLAGGSDPERNPERQVRCLFDTLSTGGDGRGRSWVRY